MVCRKTRITAAIASEDYSLKFLALNAGPKGALKSIKCCPAGHIYSQEVSKCGLLDNILHLILVLYPFLLLKLTPAPPEHQSSNCLGSSTQLWVPNIDTNGATQHPC